MAWPGSGASCASSPVTRAQLSPRSQPKLPSPTTTGLRERAREREVLHLSAAGGGSRASPLFSSPPPPFSPTPLRPGPRLARQARPPPSAHRRRRPPPTQIPPGPRPAVLPARRAAAPAPARTRAGRPEGCFVPLLRPLCFVTPRGGPLAAAAAPPDPRCFGRRAPPDRAGGRPGAPPSAL